MTGLPLRVWLALGGAGRGGSDLGAAHAAHENAVARVVSEADAAGAARVQAAWDGDKLRRAVDLSDAYTRARKEEAAFWRAREARLTRRAAELETNLITIEARARAARETLDAQSTELANIRVRGLMLATVLPAASCSSVPPPSCGPVEVIETPVDPPEPDLAIAIGSAGTARTGAAFCVGTGRRAPS